MMQVYDGVVTSAGSVSFPEWPDIYAIKGSVIVKYSKTKRFCGLSIFAIELLVASSSAFIFSDIVRNKC